MSVLKVVTADVAKLILAPELGGGIARLDVDNKPVLRPWSGDKHNLFSLAHNVLVPFSNRISCGGFNWNGVNYSLEPNLDDEIFPIHGDGFQKVWEITDSDNDICMRLSNGSFGPWRYSAEQLFKLTPNCLTITLIVKNTSEITLPFGCGFHPWFPRNDNTRLSFSAEKVWMENEDHLPTKEVLLVDDSSWSFKDLRKLPVNFINNGYTGWHGTTFIEQGEDSISCKITASNNLQTAIIYSPNDKSDFFCFEPVSHPVDAFNLPGRPGLEELVSGQSMIASMSIRWK